MIKWDIEKLSDARGNPRKKAPYDRVRLVINQVKDMMRKENDGHIKAILATAGNELNKILMK